MFSSIRLIAFYPIGIAASHFHSIIHIQHSSSPHRLYLMNIPISLRFYHIPLYPYFSRRCVLACISAHQKTPIWIVCWDHNLWQKRETGLSVPIYGRCVWDDTATWTCMYITHDHDKFQSRGTTFFILDTYLSSVACVYMYHEMIIDRWCHMTCSSAFGFLNKALPKIKSLARYSNVCLCYLSTTLKNIPSVANDEGT